MINIMANLSSTTINGDIWITGNIYVNGSSSFTLTSGQITAALGYTPYDSTNPNNYIPRVSSGRPGVTKLYRNDSDDGYNVQTNWTGTYWYLRGYSGDTLHAECKVGYADDSGKCAGYLVHTGSTNNEANKIVRTTADGYLFTSYINSAAGNEGNNSSPARVWGTNGSDSYLRTYLTSALSVGYASSAGGVSKTVNGTTETDLVYANIADNDQFRIRVGGAATNSGWAEIATADDGTEPIYVRQYTGVFTSIARTLTLLGADGNSSFPGTIIASGDITAFSDITLKDNIESIDSVLNDIKNIQPSKYNRKDLDNKQEWGLIAQNVEEYFPTFVKTQENGMKSLDYSKYSGVILTKAVQELHDICIEQQSKINKLEQLVEKLLKNNE